MNNNEIDMLDAIFGEVFSQLEEVPQIKVKQLHPLAQLPVRVHDTDAGADLFAIEDVVLPPNSRFPVRTGIAIENDMAGTYFRIAPRSGLALKQGVDVLAGVIDRGYTGEILVILLNTSKEYVTINTGDKIAQLIMEVIETPTFSWAENLAETERSGKGFGSSDQYEQKQ